jgi:hypothetical protein
MHSRKNVKKTVIIVGILKATDKKSSTRIRIRKSKLPVRGSGSQPVRKCHGSTTLRKQEEQTNLTTEKSSYANYMRSDITLLYGVRKINKYSYSYSYPGRG